MRISHFFKSFLFILFVLIGAHEVHAQDLLKGNDLSQIKVNQLSDADILKLISQLTAAGVSIDKAEQMALSKGMPQAEFDKLKQRISSLDADKTEVGKLNQPKAPVQSGRVNNSSDSLDTEKYDEKRLQPLINPLIFGSELYTGVAPSFEPNLKLATPLNYILGPDDEIQVSVFGVQQYEQSLPVSPEGNVSIPNVGQVKVGGLTIENATQKLRTVMGNTIYPYLRTGESKISVTLNKIRSIRVTVIGSNRPGNFTLSSLSTVFNALYLAGGPSAFGSFREIELMRNNKLVRKIDLYRLLSQGDQSDNVGLKDNDIIRIPTYKTRIELQGQIKRPGIFEVLPGEDFAKILSLASGFTDTAYYASVKVFQRSDTERKVLDLPSTAYNTYQPQTGDVFVISKILNRFSNRVRINGAVFRPDTYELTPELTVAGLIRKADGLKEDAFTGRGQIIRLQEDLTRSIISFDVKRALAGDASDNKILMREDEVFISSVQELRDSFKVDIQGEIRLPGKYDFVDKLTLKDLILQAGGLTDAAYKNVEIARLLKRDSITSADRRASTIINAEIDGNLTSGIADIPLEPYDAVTIRRKAGYTIPETMTVSGQVQYPGPYALESRNERVSAILKRAGGYTPDAYPEGAYLKRFKTEIEKQRAAEVLKKLQKSVGDTTNNEIVAQEVTKEYDQIPLNLLASIRSPGSIEDIVVRAGDELYIPKFNDQVKISGAVLLSTQVPYQKRNNLKDYISEAGGFSGDAWPKKAYVVYANGKAATIDRFFLFKFYPKILPGSEVVVPQKPERKSTNVGEVIGIASALASLAGVVIAILRL